MKEALRLSRQICKRETSCGERKAILTFRIHRKGVV